MPTKTIENARKLQRQLESGVAAHAIPAAEAFDAHRPDGEKLALAPVLRAIGESCRRAFEHFAAAEQTVVREDGEDRATRESRDAAAASLRQSLSRIAAAIGATYGPATVESLGLGGITPTVPDQLLTAGGRFLIATDPLPTLPPARDAWSVIDLAAARSSILGNVEGLRHTMNTAAEETRQTQSARKARDEAEEAWKREATLWATLARAVLRYSGQPDLANRLLPSSTTIRHIEADAPPSDPATDTPNDPA